MVGFNNYNSDESINETSHACVQLSIDEFKYCDEYVNEPSWADNYNFLILKFLFLCIYLLNGLIKYHLDVIKVFKVKINHPVKIYKAILADLII